MDRDALAKVGERRSRAKTRLDQLTVEAKEAARAAAQNGISESEIGDLLQVTRMTVRSWLGK